MKKDSNDAQSIRLLWAEGKHRWDVPSLKDRQREWEISGPLWGPSIPTESQISGGREWKDVVVRTVVKH